MGYYKNLFQYCEWFFKLQSVISAHMPCFSYPGHILLYRSSGQTAHKFIEASVKRQFTKLVLQL